MADKRCLGGALSTLSRAANPRRVHHKRVSDHRTLISWCARSEAPIFYGSGLPARTCVAGSPESDLIGEDTEFAVVFAAGRHQRELTSSRRSSSAPAPCPFGPLPHKADDPAVERLLTPKRALTRPSTWPSSTASTCSDPHRHEQLLEALREIGGAREEILVGVGPGYMYTDLGDSTNAQAWLRACRLHHQLPILTCPTNDVTHPIPTDRYITEGQTTWRGPCTTRVSTAHQRVPASAADEQGSARVRPQGPQERGRQVAV